MNATFTNAVELKIAKKTIDALLSAGYQLGVNDGGETTIVHSMDKNALVMALRTTDEDYLIVYQQDGQRVGWVRFIWGNGIDVVCDYTTNIITALEPVDDYVATIDRVLYA